MPNQTVSIIAWKRLSGRSELLAKALNAKLWFFKDRLPYAIAATKTLLRILKEKPGTMIVQLPQGPLLLEALIIGRLIGSRVAADVHTGFMLRTDWKGLFLNVPFLKFLPAADLIIVHNDAQLNLLPKKLWKKTLIVFDPWYLATNLEPADDSSFEKYIVFPASFAPDEPLEEVIRSMNASRIDAKLYVTGNWKRQPTIKDSASDKVVFTGYLPNKEFNCLMAGARAIVTGTKREYTSLMSSWEAVAYAKPLAVTDTATLRKLLGEYAIFYNWKQPESVTQSIELALTQKPNIAAREKLRRRTMELLQEFQKRMQNLGNASSAVKHTP